MMIPLGQFELTSGSMVVSDPCYDLNPDTIIMGVLDRALNGTWDAYVHKAEVRDWGEACTKLVACHSAFRDKQDLLEWVKCNFIVGVDSGQAGIFDASQYRIPDPEAPEPDTTDSEWYLACCDITGSETEAGVLDGGVVSHSGLGDGGYAAYAAADGEGRIIGVKIVFIKEADL